MKKLNLIIAHKDEIIAQKNSEIATLKTLVEILQNKSA